MAKQKVEAAPVPAIAGGGDLPEWFFGEDGVEPYSVGGESASGDGLPFVGCANPKAGGGGGRTSWADLQAAGCAVGDAFASGGVLQAPRRLAGVATLLLRCVRIAYVVGEGFRPEGTRRIADKSEALSRESQAIDALLLVLDPAGPFLATYRERLSDKIGWRSTVVGPWVDRLAKAGEPASMPRWARLAGRIRSEPKVSKKSGQTYYRESVATGPLSAPEVELLGSWLKGPGMDSRNAVAAWDTRFEGPEGFPGDAGDPFAPDAGS